MKVYERLLTDYITTKYLFNISKSKRVLYVSTPKVACTTIIHSMQIAEEPRYVDYDVHAIHDRDNSPLFMPLEDDALFGEAVFGDYFRFSFVRNPFTRILSCYLDKIPQQRFRLRHNLPLDTEISFYQFLLNISASDNLTKDVHWTPQFILLSYGTIEYNFLGRFEYIQEELKKLQNMTGIDFSRRNSPNAQDTMKHINKYYTQKEIDLVTKLYAPDFKFFGYTKDIRAI